MLVLPIKRKWLEMIADGEKKEEYREIKDFYNKRLLKYFGGQPVTNFGMLEIKEFGFGVKLNPNKVMPIILRNGYRHDSPQIKCLCTLDIGTGNLLWRSRNRQSLLRFKNKENSRSKIFLHANGTYRRNDENMEIKRIEQEEQKKNGKNKDTDETSKP